MTIENLQNGSDIRGIAIATDEFEITLTEEIAEQVGRGIVNWLVAEKGLGAELVAQKLTIAVGQDSRLSGEMLKAALIKGIRSQGANAVDTGLSTTPAMFKTTQFPDFNCDAGVMITASHLPYYFNGIKIFSREGGAEHEDIAYILSHTEPNEAAELGHFSGREVLTLYAQDLVAKIRQGTGLVIDKPLASFKIIVDAGNGAAGFFAEKVLVELGANTTGSQFLEPDGHFPNHIPNPDNAEAMASIRQAVLDNHADLGVIFDTDVDRSAIVDKFGNTLNRNNLIAILAKIVLESEPNATIVTNSPTSTHLKHFINRLGGKQVRYLCGYRNVINKAIELNAEGIDTPLAIETSGHAAFRENDFLDDGAYVIAKILMLLPQLKTENREISDLIAEMAQPVETNEIRFKINLSDYRFYGENVIATFADFIAKIADFKTDLDNEEGIRVNFTGNYGQGWFLLRMSLHEPLLVLQVENDVSGKNELVIAKLLEFFAEFSNLTLPNF
ncbi:phosphoglucomutase [Lactococcus hodotermopsidis]|uniref:Phosphoglucomutase n=1 Tax=Pseudolactococcus hodotermopsidis TaxID=2709157 RepID=A0A6A0BA17_9LACT|nr:phosphomannomutase/phosphoglucomutase [Lactococcus hodotermopsidis]GFH42222.1 phosphoglucomutase [Lactococcus hodotermopsidis]